MIYQAIRADLIAIYFLRDCCSKDLCNLDIYLHIIDPRDDKEVFCGAKAEIFKARIINKNDSDVMYICNIIYVMNVMIMDEEENKNDR